MRWTSRVTGGALAVLLFVSGVADAQVAAGGRRAAAKTTFANPLLPSGPDPWAVYKDGFYYFMRTTGVDLTIYKTRSLAKLRKAKRKVVWTPPPSGPNSRDVWAPELHFLQGAWYVYVAADDGRNESHRLWVLENPSPDPLKGRWTMKGKLADATDKWAIDGTVFEHRGRLYAMWSGWEGDVNVAQNIYIASMANPWTIDGPRVLLSRPTYDWERVGDLGGGAHVDVNEGPEFLAHDDKVFVVYSASGCWTDAYALGMLTADADADLLDPSSWTKSPTPVFASAPDAGAYGPGHNGFFVSPDGTESWILYHANPRPGQGCGDARSPRMQPFTWRDDGTPDFGRPVPLGVKIPKPSGER